MGVVLGLLVAPSIGSTDFLGGLASRRAPTLFVLAVAQVAAIVLAEAVTLGLGGPVHTGAATGSARMGAGTIPDGLPRR